MNKELYEMLQKGMSAEEITKELNEAQKQLDKDRAAEAERIRIEEEKEEELEIARQDLASSILYYFEALGHEFTEEQWDETWEAILDILYKCEENGFGIKKLKKSSSLADYLFENWWF